MNPKLELHAKWSRHAAEAAATVAKARPDSDQYKREWAVWNAYENGAALLKASELDRPQTALDVVEEALGSFHARFVSDDEPRADCFEAMLTEFKKARQ